MLKRFCSLFVLVAFLATSVVGPNASYAQGVFLPAPGTMVATSPVFVPVIAKGLTVHADNPLLFDFLIDTGNSGLQAGADDAAIRAESQKLIKYFLASLTLPEKDQWVNLSPYEKDRTLPAELGQTELGRDMLAQDYVLKQMTASMLYPENGLGKEFWQRVYERAQKEFGTTEVPVDTFNKVWVSADTADVFVKQQPSGAGRGEMSAFVVESHLKVMLESDYLAAQKSDAGRQTPDEKDEVTGDPASDPSGVQDVSKQIIREIIIPELEKEVNTGKNFANLRQMFHSMILATWYKKNLKDAFLTRVYADQKKTNGVEGAWVADKGADVDPEKIWSQYVEAYKKGVFNFIKEETDPATGESVPRKYFSGGMMNLARARVVPGHGRLAGGKGIDGAVLKVRTNLVQPGSGLDDAMGVAATANPEALRLLEYLLRHQEYPEGAVALVMDYVHGLAPWQVHERGRSSFHWPVRETRRILDAAFLMARLHDVPEGSRAAETTRIAGLLNQRWDILEAYYAVEAARATAPAGKTEIALLEELEHQQLLVRRLAAVNLQIASVLPAQWAGVFPGLNSGEFRDQVVASTFRTLRPNFDQENDPRLQSFMEDYLITGADVGRMLHSWIGQLDSTGPEKISTRAIFLGGWVYAQQMQAAGRINREQAIQDEPQRQRVFVELTRLLTYYDNNRTTDGFDLSPLRHALENAFHYEDWQIVNWLHWVTDAFKGQYYPLNLAAWAATGNRKTAEQMVDAFMRSAGREVDLYSKERLVQYLLGAEPELGVNNILGDSLWVWVRHPELPTVDIRNFLEDNGVTRLRDYFRGKGLSEKELSSLEIDATLLWQRRQLLTQRAAVTASLHEATQMPERQRLSEQISALDKQIANASQFLTRRSDSAMTFDSGKVSAVVQAYVAAHQLPAGVFEALTAYFNGGERNVATLRAQLEALVPIPTGARVPEPTSIEFLLNNFDQELTAMTVMLAMGLTSGEKVLLQGALIRSSTTTREETLAELQKLSNPERARQILAAGDELAVPYTGEVMYHVMRQADWEIAGRAGRIDLPADKPYLSFSTAADALYVANRYLSGADKLVVVRIETKNVNRKLIGMAEGRFPHYYGAVSLENAEAFPLERGTSKIGDQFVWQSLPLTARVQGFERFQAVDEVLEPASYRQVGSPVVGEGGLWRMVASHRLILAGPGQGTVFVIQRLSTAGRWEDSLALRSERVWEEAQVIRAQTSVGQMLGAQIASVYAGTTDQGTLRTNLRAMVPALNHALTVALPELAQVVDRAEIDTAATVSRSNLVNGGIDLNAGKMQMNERGDAAQFTFDPAMVAQFKSGNFTGLTPVILNISTVPSLAPLLGMEADAKQPEKV